MDVRNGMRELRASNPNAIFGELFLMSIDALSANYPNRDTLLGEYIKHRDKIGSSKRDRAEAVDYGG